MLPRYRPAFDPATSPEVLARLANDAVHLSLRRSGRRSLYLRPWVTQGLY